MVPDALIDLRYATTNNFTHTQLYPADARCLVHESMAPGLAAAATALRPQGQLLVFWDCYRPHDVQVRMFNVVPNPAWVARPGPYARSHTAGRSVDVTFTSPQPQCPPERQDAGSCLADMGTGFDDFSPRATAFATQDVSVEAQANRKRLRDAMGYGGLTVYSGRVVALRRSGLRGRPSDSQRPRRLVARAVPRKREVPPAKAPDTPGVHGLLRLLALHLVASRLYIVR